MSTSTDSPVTDPSAASQDNDKECQICNEPFDSGSEPETPVKLTCGHTFGSVCISRWLHVPGRRHTCPTCRRRFFTAQRVLPEDRDIPRQRTEDRDVQRQRSVSEVLRHERDLAMEAIRNLTEQARQLGQQSARVAAENRVLRNNQAHGPRNPPHVTLTRLPQGSAQSGVDGQPGTIADEATQNRSTSPTSNVLTQGATFHNGPLAPGETIEREQRGVQVTVTGPAQNTLVQFGEDAHPRSRAPGQERWSRRANGSRRLANFLQPQFPEPTPQQVRAAHERSLALARSRRPARDGSPTGDLLDVSDVDGRGEVRSNFASNRQILRNHGNPVQPNFRSRVSNGTGTQASTNLAPPLRPTNLLAAANGEDLPLRPTRPSNLTRDPTARVERVAMPSRRLPIRSHPLTPEELGLRDDSDT